MVVLRVYFNWMLKGNVNQIESLTPLYKVMRNDPQRFFTSSFSLRTGEVPQDWEVAMVAPIHKSGDKKKKENCL